MSMEKSAQEGSFPGEPSAWDRMKAALHRDWMQTRHDIGRRWGDDLDQGIGDTLAQATGSQVIPPPHVQNDAAPWSDEDAVWFGYTAAQSPTLRDRGAWSATLEAIVRQDWERQHPVRPWADVHLAVRYGWARAKGPISE